MAGIERAPEKKGSVDKIGDPQAEEVGHDTRCHLIGAPKHRQYAKSQARDGTHHQRRGKSEPQGRHSNKRR